MHRDRDKYGKRGHFNLSGKKGHFGSVGILSLFFEDVFTMFEIF